VTDVYVLANKMHQSLCNVMILSAKP